MSKTTQTTKPATKTPVTPEERASRKASRKARQQALRGALAAVNAKLTPGADAQTRKLANRLSRIQRLLEALQTGQVKRVSKKTGQDVVKTLTAGGTVRLLGKVFKMAGTDTVVFPEVQQELRARFPWADAKEALATYAEGVGIDFALFERVLLGEPTIPEVKTPEQQRIAAIDVPELPAGAEEMMATGLAIAEDDDGSMAPKGKKASKKSKR